jgi:hypothetical protein
MRQALHIFRKDVRRAWPQIALVLLLTAVVAREQVLRTFSSVAILVSGIGLFPLLVLAWFYLIATVVQDDRLVGDQQFWLTRPYSWKSLLVAKGLFLAVFIHLSVFLADMAILTALRGSETQASTEEHAYIRVALAPRQGLKMPLESDRTAAGEIVLPIQVVGLTPGAKAESHRWELRLDGMGEAISITNLQGGRIEWQPGETQWVHFYNDRLQHLIHDKRNFRVAVNLDIFGTGVRSTATVHDGTVKTPGVGVCFIAPDAFPWSYPAVACRLPEWPTYELETARGTHIAWAADSPIRMVGGISPVFTTYPSFIKPEEAAASSITFVRRYRIARIECELHLNGVRLADYMAGKELIESQWNSDVGCDLDLQSVRLWNYLVTK